MGAVARDIVGRCRARRGKRTTTTLKGGRTDGPATFYGFPVCFISTNSHKTYNARERRHLTQINSRKLEFTPPLTTYMRFDISGPVIIFLFRPQPTIVRAYDIIFFLRVADSKKIRKKYEK